MLTSKVPYEFNNLPELIDKIKNENPIPPRKYFADIKNKYENIIFKLLEKNPYQRYLNIDELISVFESDEAIPKREYDLSPRFVLRLWNEGSALDIYFQDHNDKLNVDFPAIHQFQQKKLLQRIQYLCLYLSIRKWKLQIFPLDSLMFLYNPTSPQSVSASSVPVFP